MTDDDFEDFTPAQMVALILVQQARIASMGKELQTFRDLFHIPTTHAVGLVGGHDDADADFIKRRDTVAAMKLGLLPDPHDGLDRWQATGTALGWLAAAIGAATVFLAWVLLR